MIFNYLKYISPVWYFNLKPKVDFSYFPTYEQLNIAGIKLEYDDKYISDEAKNRDLAYRAFQLGYISIKKEASGGINIWKKTKLPRQDEFRFLRKNFNPLWVFYVLAIRLLGLNNPFREIHGFLTSRDAFRERYNQKHLDQPDLNSFDSSLLKSNPRVSVIIPTLNRYKYLKDVFRDLEKQTYKNFEVIVVDQTDPFDKSVYEDWELDIKFWYQNEKALWKARNAAINSSKGDYILLYDDDSLVESDWIEKHLVALDYFNADLSSGVSISAVGAKVPAHYSYFRWSDQLDTGNVLVRKEIFTKIGLFDTKFEKQRMGDGEFGLRAYLSGYRNISNPLAKRIHLKVGQGGLRQMGSWDGWRPKKFFGPRPVPSILYLFRKYYGNSAARWALLKNVPASIVPYQFKGNKVFIVLGIFISILIVPIVSVQVIFSWYKSSSILKN